MKMKRTTVPLVFFLLSVLLPAFAAANTFPVTVDSLPGVKEGEGFAFQITDSDYLNITLTSSEPIRMRLESVPNIITMRSDAAASSTSATSTLITIRGLLPDTPYYKYQDSYRNLELLFSSTEGKVTYTQDISHPHYIFIQPTKSTKFISNNSTGGDCASIGVWNASILTCTLTTDLIETVEIDGDGITLDGAGHTSTGSHTGSGVYLDERSEVTIKNMRFRDFSFGISLNASVGTHIEDNIFENNDYQAIVYYNSNKNTASRNSVSLPIPSRFRRQGFAIFESRENVFRDNTVSLNQKVTISARNQGILLFDSNDNALIANSVSDTYQAILLFNSNDNVIRDNLVQDTLGEGFMLYPPSRENKIYHNNFIRNNISATDYEGETNVYSLPLPDGGNYWDIFDEPSEGCTDTSGDGICDAAYNFPYTQDALPWTKKDGWKNPPAPKVSNVLFLPGVEASRLYYRGALGIEHQVWEPNYHTDIPYLEMNADGTSKYSLYTKDIVERIGAHSAYQTVIDKIFGSNFDTYGGFQTYMDGLVASTTLGLKEWRAYPYDWRYDVRDVVENGTLTKLEGNIERVFLKDVLREIASTSASKKVTIVAHSNGGLLAKALALSLGADAPNYIDRIVMIGTPQWGTPSDIGVMLHGDDQTHGLGLISNASDVRAVIKDMPSPYGLLPSAEYFAHIDDPVVTFSSDGSLAGKYASNFGTALSSFSALVDFLANTAGLNAQAGSAGDLRTPLALSSTLIDKAVATHSALDAWTPPAGITVTAIAGWGQDTVKALAYTTKRKMSCNSQSAVASPSLCAEIQYLEHSPVTTQNGDGTVVSPSAVGDTAEHLYFNADAFRSDARGNITHQDLTSAGPIQSTIFKLLRNSDVSEEYVFDAKPPVGNNPITLRISSHSPVNIVVTDSENNESGVVPIPGSDFAGVKRDVPESSVQVFDDEQYISVPKSGAYAIVATGYGNGSATLNVDAIGSDGGITASTTFSNIPTSANSIIKFAVKDGSATLPAVDVDGDGVTDFTAIAITPSTNPLAYLRYMKTVINILELPQGAKSPLLAELSFIERQLATKSKKKPPALFFDVQKVQFNVVLGVASKHIDKQVEKEWISSTNAEIILGMIRELKMLLKL